MPDSVTDTHVTPSQPTQSAPHMWRGQQITQLVLVIMVVVGGVLGYVLWVYGQIDRAREDSLDAWRAVATELDSRFREVDQRVEQAVAAGEIPAEQSSQFREQLDQFRTTADPRRQLEALDEMQAAVDELPPAVAIPAVDPDLQAAQQLFNESLERQRSILASPGGRLLTLFVDIPVHEALGQE